MTTEAQQLFDQAVNGIRAQGRRSVGTNGSGGPMCAYRGPDGCKCAAGHLISDADYSPAMENSQVDTICNEAEFNDRPSICVIGRHLYLVQALQNAHDTAAKTDWYVQLTSLSPSLVLNKLPPARQEELVEEAFAIVAEDFGLRYERQPWKQLSA